MINDQDLIQNSASGCSARRQLSGIAIIIGALIGFGLGFLLDLLGLALELKLFSTTNTGATVIAFGGMMIILIGLIATMFIAGYITGYLAREKETQRKFGLIYGLTTWSLILLLNVLLAMPLNRYIANFTNLSPPETLASNSQDLNLETEPSEISNANTSIINPSSNPSSNTSPKVIAEGAFIIFVLFLLSAFSSCMGSFWALSAKGEKSAKP